MNKLPAVLQKEIWEYVRGDRAYWKQQFSNVMTKIDTWKFVRISRPINGFTARLCNNDPESFDLYIFANDKAVDFLASIVDQNSAILEFEILTKIVHREFGQLKIGDPVDLESLYRAWDEWKA